MIRNKIKNKIFRTRQLVKKALEDLERLRGGMARLEENLAPTGDGLAAWSPVIQTRVRRLFSLLQPHALVGLGKVRLGGQADGGYVVPEDWGRVSSLFSLGVGPDNSFDLAFAEAGIGVQAFDHTITRLPVEHPKIRWHKKKIDVPREHSPHTCSLQEALKAENTTGELALKLDIEGWEYPVLLDCAEDEFRKIRFLVGEFHGLARNLEADDTHILEAVFQKLQKYFAVVHVHGNNAGGIRLLGGCLVPNHLEITWVNRANYAIEPCRETFPTSLDRPNLPGRCDIWLGSFNFTRDP
jgi:hypothetical protein